MIRGFLAILFLVLFLIVSIPIFLVHWILLKINPKLAETMGFRIVQGAFKCISFICGTRLIVRGYENVPKDEAVVYIGNHRSFFDVIMTYPLCPQLTGFIAKDSFKKVPLLSTWMKFLHCQFLDRTNTRAGMQMVLDSIQAVKDGISIFIFPEGTRSKTEEMLPFHGGSFKIATKAGAKIVPVAVTNGSYIFEDHFPKYPWITRGTVVVSYGEPIDTAEMDRNAQKTLPKDCQRQIAQMLLENGKVWEENALKSELKKPRSASNPGCKPEEAE